MGLLDADTTQLSTRRSSFWLLAVAYLILFIVLGSVAIYFLVSRQTQFDPALGREGAIWLEIFGWIVLSIFSLCGHVVAVIINRPILDTVTGRQVVMIMVIETILTLIVMYVMTVLLGQWMVIATPLVMAFLVMLMLRRYKNKKQIIP